MNKFIKILKKVLLAICCIVAVPFAAVWEISSALISVLIGIPFDLIYMKDTNGMKKKYVYGALTRILDDFTDLVESIMDAFKY